ncbi:DUF84 family protein [Candidatus Curtissbacteria bacterium]|nr:DUF84 family protein [Candidatus Curtissbacteria bacterium]
MLVVVGSASPAKISAAKIAFKKVFPKEKLKVVGVEAESGISPQPMSDPESIRGAINRAKRALKLVKGADFAVGMEGGLHKVGKNWFESGWIAVINREGKLGLGTSARWQTSAKIMGKLNDQNELATVFEEITGVEDAKDIGGVMSLVTKRNLPRDIAYSHGVIFALAPFFSDPEFWD